MLAAAAGEASHIKFGGAVTMQHASDTADYFIAAARLESSEARVHNISGHATTVDEIAGAIVAAAPEIDGKISWDADPLPIVGDIRGEPLDAALGHSLTHKPLAEGIAETIEDFRRLRRNGFV